MGNLLANKDAALAAPDAVRTRYSFDAGSAQDVNNGKRCVCSTRVYVKMLTSLEQDYPT